MRLFGRRGAQRIGASLAFAARCDFCGWMDRDENLQTCSVTESLQTYSTRKIIPDTVPVKRHRGEPGRTRDTHGTHGRTRAHGSHRRTSQNRSNEHNMFYPNPTTHPHDHATAATQQPHEQPQARSRPLPAADSEEAAPSKPDPAGQAAGHQLPERLSPRACSVRRSAKCAAPCVF